MTVKTVSALSGVSGHTLRAWEKRYQAVSPKRAQNGRRIYSMEDVEKLKLLSQLVAIGHSIGTIARLNRAALERLAQQAIQSAVPSADLEFTPTIDSLVRALKDYRLSFVAQELARIRMIYSVRVLMLRFYAALMREIGAQVASGELSIAQEHAFSALLRNQLEQIYAGSLRTETHGPRAILSSAEGDLHEFGLFMSAILCASHGLIVDYLGPNLPARDFAEAATRTQAQLVILGTKGLVAQSAFTQLERYLWDLTAALPAASVLIVGGDRLNEIDRQWRRPVHYMTDLAQLDSYLGEFTKA